MFSLLLLLTTIQPLNSHMSMQFPEPRDKQRGVNYEVWKQNEPMISVRPQICHGLDPDPTVRAANIFNVGDSIKINIFGGAPHNGGHCAFWISTDDITFTKIIDVKDCTIKPTQVILPPSLPTQCQTKCTFAFTWVPVSSGLCEIYMNCADIRVNGVNGGMPSTISINFATRFIQNTTNNGCVRVNEATHWTYIFNDIKDTYDNGVIGNGNEVGDRNPPKNIGICYLNPKRAINLNNPISSNGTCGDNTNSARCDDGQCCSILGYCGPDWDGSGYKNYDKGGYYSNEEEAFNAYCSLNVGDWRIDNTNSCISYGFNNFNVFNIIVIISLLLVINFVFY